MEDIIIDKTKTISDEELKFNRNILRIKLDNPRLPRENILRVRVLNGDIQENGKFKEET